MNSLRTARTSCSGSSRGFDAVARAELAGTLPSRHGARMIVSHKDRTAGLGGVLRSGAKALFPTCKHTEAFFGAGLKASSRPVNMLKRRARPGGGTQRQVQRGRGIAWHTGN
jgi:hypothetical protein